MQRSLSTLLVLFSLPLAAIAADDTVKSLAHGSSIPGSFQTWMVTGSHAGRYHSPVAEHGLGPVVLIFVREMEGPDKPLADLLKKLDEISIKHPDVRLRACAIFLNDAGLRDALAKTGEEYARKYAETTVVKDDLETKLKGLAKAKELNRVDLAMDQSAGPRNYPLDEKAQITVLLYNQHTVLDYKAFAKDKLNEVDVKNILADVTKAVTAIEGQLRRRARQ